MISLRSMRAELALRELCAAPASTFGRRLLARANGGPITFHEFIALAREMVRSEPDAMATWLAALVALEVRSQDPEQTPPGPPSPN
jgi:hypothetical protein